MKYFKTYESYVRGVRGVGSLKNSLAALKRQNIRGRYTDAETLAKGIRNEYEAITGEKYEDEVQMSMDDAIADIVSHFKLDGPEFMAAWDKVVKESVNESYKGNFSDFKYELELAIDNLGISPKAIKAVKKKGKGYEVRMSSYMSDKNTWERIGTDLGAELIDFKPGSINVGIYEGYITEKKPKGSPEFHHSDAPDAEGRFRDLNPKDLAAWLIKTRKKDLKKISGSLTQQVVFNRNDDPAYAEKMEKTRKEVYKQLGREDLLDKK